MSDTAQPPGRKHIAQHWVLAGLLIFTLIVRGSVLWGMRENLEQDPDAYREIAENVLLHGDFALGRPINEGRPRSTAYRPPLYPLVLSNLPDRGAHNISLFGVAATHVGLGIATVWLTWLAARKSIPTAMG